jgi:hypothetical protein
MTPDEIPGVMDYLGVDQIILLPNKMLTFGKLAGEDERPVVLANGYIDYMLDQVVDPNAGIYTMIVAPYQDPDEAVALIERVGDEPAVHRTDRVRKRSRGRRGARLPSTTARLRCHHQRR